jgi:monothiol glutaredoxin
MSTPIEEEINQEITQHKILIYGKGTKSAPQCGFTVETMEFFNKFGYPYELVNVLPNPEKREALSKMSERPSPK